jgi:DNA-binding GntR family transcriptional regulator
MFTLDSGNVLLKPSHRKQLMSSLRRSLRLGQRVGKFVLTITMQRIGKSYEVRIAAQDSIGALACRTRRHDWRDAMRELVRRLTSWLHEQHLRPHLG